MSPATPYAASTAPTTASPAEQHAVPATGDGRRREQPMRRTERRQPGDPDPGRHQGHAQHLREHGLAGDQQGAVRAGRPAHGVQERVVHDRQAGTEDADRHGHHRNRAETPTGHRRHQAEQHDREERGDDGGQPRTTAVHPPTRPSRARTRGGLTRRATPRPPATARTRRQAPAASSEPLRQTHHVGRGRHVGVSRDDGSAWGEPGGDKGTEADRHDERADPGRPEKGRRTPRNRYRRCHASECGTERCRYDCGQPQVRGPHLRWWLRWRNGRGRRASVAPTPEGARP